VKSPDADRAAQAANAPDRTRPAERAENPDDDAGKKIKGKRDANTWMIGARILLVDCERTSVEQFRLGKPSCRLKQ
jgi:hypothetical protein